MTKIDSNLDIESWKILKGYKDNPIIEEVLFKDLISHDFRSFSEKFKSYKLSIPVDQVPAFVSVANKTKNL